MDSETSERKILETALRCFNDATGLNASFVFALSPEVLVKVTVGDRSHTFVANINKTVDRTSILLRDRVSTSTNPPLLVAPYISKAIARVCRTHNIPFIDCAGNAFLETSNGLVFITGQRGSRLQRTAEKPSRIFSERGLRILFNCLVNPELLQAPYRTIADVSKTALGTVSAALSAWKNEGIVSENSQGERHWLRKEEMQQAWIINYPHKLRPNLAARRFRARTPTWWQQANPTSFGMQWGSEVAAARLTNELEPITVTLYAHETIARFVGEHRLVADPAGNVEILNAFWPATNPQLKNAEIVNPLLICTDLIAIGDPRTTQVARTIREQYLR